MTEQLKKYEYAELAHKAYNSKNVKAAVDAMAILYENLDVPKDDPVINRALAEAKLGISDGNLTSSTILEAMNIYAGKYDEELKKTKIRDFLDYVDYDADNIPEEMKKLFSKYEGETLSELIKDYENGDDKKELDEKDKEKVAVISAINSLVEYRIETKLYPNIFKRKTKQNLEAIASNFQTINLPQREKRKLLMAA